jgi:hypothetical protein
MTNQNEIAGTPGASEVETNPPNLPSVTIKPGWQTSEAHLTALFGVASVVLSLLGLHYTPDRIQNIYEAVLDLLKVFGPIAAFVPILFNYITSRGKAKSSGFDVGSILGGRDWKDPQRYIDLAKLAGTVAPGGGAITKILDKTGLGGKDTAHTLTDNDILGGFQQVSEQLATISDGLHKITNILQAHNLREDNGPK